MKTYRIAMIPGDGIGKEVIPAGRELLDALAKADASFRFDFADYDWGGDYHRRHGVMMPADGLDALKDADAILFGSAGDPDIPDHITLWGLRLKICQGFDQYANVRPTRILPGIDAPLKRCGPKDLDWVIVRENSEGEYSGVGGRVHQGHPIEAATDVSMMTRVGVERIQRFAFELARSRPRKQLTVVTKSNAQRHAMVMWDEIAMEVARDYPDVRWDKELVDACTARMVNRPASLDTLVATNLHADILSDLAAALAGSLGIAPTGNIDPERRYPSMFEPIHGSAFDIMGQGLANPVGTFWSVVMLLEHLGETAAAARVMRAIERVTADATLHTRDLGGQARTADVTNAMIRFVTADTERTKRNARRDARISRRGDDMKTSIERGMRRALAATLAMIAFAAQAQSAQNPIVIKFSHVVAAETNKGKTAEYFKKVAEERTKGAVRIEVYANSILFKDKEELEALQVGAVQMLAPTPGKFGPLGAREFEVLDLPYLFDNLADEHKVTQGAIGRQLLGKLEQFGVHGLAFWDNGFKEMTSNKALRTPADFKGQKLRIQSSKVIEAQMRAVDAIPQVMAFAELYQAMQTGVVDGQENPTNVIYPSKLYEVQKYLTLSDHGYHGYAVITNAKFWASLPAPIRAQLESAMKDATAFFNDGAKKENDDGLAAIKASGRTEIITLSPDEKKTWKRAFLKVHEEMAPRVGKQLVQQIYRETGFDPAKF